MENDYLLRKGKESDYVQMSWKRNDERFGRCGERNRVGDLN